MNIGTLVYQENQGNLRFGTITGKELDEKVGHISLSIGTMMVVIIVQWIGLVSCAMMALIDTTGIIGLMS